MPAFLFGARRPLCGAADRGGCGRGRVWRRGTSWITTSPVQVGTERSRMWPVENNRGFALVHRPPSARYTTANVLCMWLWSAGEGSERCCFVGRGGTCVYLMKGWLLRRVTTFKRVYLWDHSLEEEVFQPWNKEWQWIATVPSCLPRKAKLLRETPQHSNNLLPSSLGTRTNKCHTENRQTGATAAESLCAWSQRGSRSGICLHPDKNASLW